MPKREVLSSRIGFVVLMAGAAFCCLCASVAAPAEGPDAGPTRHVPASMSAKEYDAMLDDIAEAVAQRLRGASGQTAVQPSAQTGAGMAKQGQGQDAFNDIGQLLNRAGEVVRSLPRLHSSLAEMTWRLGGGEPGGFGRFFLKLLLGAVLAVCAEKAMRRFIMRLWREPIPKAGNRPPLASRTVGRALLDISALIPLWLVLYGFSASGIAEDWLQQKAAGIIFTNVLIWRVAVLIPRIWFRPKDPELRIAAVDDRDARTLYYTLSVASLAYMSARSIVSVLIAAEAPTDAIITASFFGNLIYTIVDYTAIFVTWQAAARWLASLVKDDGSVFATIKLRLAKYWWAIAMLADTVMTVAIAYGSLSGNLNVGSARRRLPHPGPDTYLSRVSLRLSAEARRCCSRRDGGPRCGQAAPGRSPRPLLTLPDPFAHIDGDRRDLDVRCPHRALGRTMRP